MSAYIASDRSRPWIVLFQAADLAEMAAAVAAQPDPAAFEVRATDGAGTRNLTPDEHEALSKAAAHGARSPDLTAHGSLRYVAQARPLVLASGEAVSDR
ncbi:MAG: hypothetical protein JHC95_16295 [Solirubrobacteraceae bacterium]|nr:hypothetical protein [Solirubrobacteraceae bacterium]